MDNESAGLAEIRRRRNWIYGWAVAGLPLIFGGGVLLGPDSVFVTVGWAAVMIALISRHLVARCPRCREYFNWSSAHRHRFAERCVRCGLALEDE